VPFFATEIFPVSSETTITILSDSLEIPIADLCLVPKLFDMFLSFAKGNMHAAAIILLSLIITAPSWRGVLGWNIFTNIWGEISAPIAIPDSIISFNFISLSITIKAPVFAFESSVAAITNLYIFSFFFVAISCSIPKNLFILLEPNCSNALRNSGWNITISNITPYVIKVVNIKLSILKFKNELKAVAIIKNIIPFNSWRALLPLAIWKNFTARNKTIAISIANVIKLYGLFNKLLKKAFKSILFMLGTSNVDNIFVFLLCNNY